jgi:hypothetical protein
MLHLCAQRLEMSSWRGRFMVTLYRPVFRGGNAAVSEANRLTLSSIASATPHAGASTQVAKACSRRLFTVARATS